MHILFFFFFNDTATTEIYTLSLHDALPISGALSCSVTIALSGPGLVTTIRVGLSSSRSEEHTSELQSQSNLVCRLLLEKKKKTSTFLLFAISAYLHLTTAISPFKHHPTSIH